jgi:TRAP-type C4-dicarboxylate transport system substrate-binding protein
MKQHGRPQDKPGLSRPGSAVQSPRGALIMTHHSFLRFLPSVLGAWLLCMAPAFAETVLKISHQFPAAADASGDFRDQLARKFAEEVGKRSKGEIKVEVFPSGSLVKATGQFSALRKGTLDMSVLPLAYGGGEVAEVNLTLMPALITSYEQAYRWKGAPIGKELEKILDAKGIRIVTWVWQAGGFASRATPIVTPQDAKGLKIRGGDRTMELVLKEAGASVVSLPSSEIYSGMSSGVLDGAMTSSTSLISYRLYELSKSVTSARKRSIWFMFEPLLISKATWDRLTPAQQKIVTDVGASLEKYAFEAAKADDQRLADVYGKAGVKVVDMDDAAFNHWRELAQKSSYRDFAEKAPNGQALLDMALAVK